MESSDVTGQTSGALCLVHYQCLKSLVFWGEQVLGNTWWVYPSWSNQVCDCEACAGSHLSLPCAWAAVAFAASFGFGNVRNVSHLLVVNMSKDSVEIEWTKKIYIHIYIGCAHVNVYMYIYIYTHSFFQAISYEWLLDRSIWQWFPSGLFTLGFRWCAIAIMHELVSLRVEGLPATKVKLFKHKEFSSLEVGFIDDQWGLLLLTFLFFDGIPFRSVDVDLYGYPNNSVFRLLSCPSGFRLGFFQS